MSEPVRTRKIDTQAFVPAQSRPHKRINLRLLLLTALAIPFLLMVVFVVMAASLQVVTSPVAARVDISPAWPSVRLADRLLLLPGTYEISAAAEGYQSLTQKYDLGRGAQLLRLDLNPLPGIVEIDSAQEFPMELYIDGELAGVYTPPIRVEMQAGVRQIRFDADLYQAWQQDIAVEGFARSQFLQVELQPAASALRIESHPAGALVWLDGAQMGTTPLSLDAEWGQRELLLSYALYNDFRQTIEIEPADTERLVSARLQPKDGELRLTSYPSGVSVTLDGVFQGQTPLTLDIAPLQNREVRFFRAGYDPLLKTVALELGEERDLEVVLKPQTGQISLSVSPSNAQVYIGDTLVGRGDQQLVLPAVKHTLRVELAGYQAQTMEVVPSPQIAQNLRFSLMTDDQARWADIPVAYSASDAAELILFRSPGRVEIGSDRSETERRANETRWAAQLERSFYLSKTQVTNQQFRRFEPDHSSGNFNSISLDGEEQPVVNITWQQAALYCNWLSEREGLSAFYQTSRGFVSGVNPESNGYRLMTEAEWVFAAATSASGLRLKYSWGNSETLAASENVAGSELANMVNFYLPEISDNFRTTAPVGSFAANARGLYDMAGNASEWIHDWYSPQPYAENSLQTDPLGPDIGEFHVIRGASWSRGYLPQIRLAYRDYGALERNDTGFRIARYAE